MLAGYRNVAVSRGVEEVRARLVQGVQPRPRLHEGGELLLRSPAEVGPQLLARRGRGHGPGGGVRPARGRGGAGCVQRHRSPGSAGQGRGGRQGAVPGPARPLLGPLPPPLAGPGRGPALLLLLLLLVLVPVGQVQPLQRPLDPVLGTQVTLARLLRR